jgi:hypothetical protein
MPADSLHVSQMKGLVAPEVEPPALTVWAIQAHNEKAAAKAEKAEAKEQSSSDAAPAEEEN